MVKFPDVVIVLTQGESSGGTEGSVVNHVAFRVQTFAAVEAAGLEGGSSREFPWRGIDDDARG